MLHWQRWRVCGGSCCKGLSGSPTLRMSDININTIDTTNI
jgi:hypothetical protein